MDGQICGQTIAIPKNGDFTGTDIVKIMKQHLRTKYEKYRSYNDEDLERSILSFLNEYVIEMKTKEDEGNPMGDQMLELHD
jgi:hypothetical protein